MRPACPPLLFGCKFLNFSRSNSVLELAGRRAMLELSGRNDDETAGRYANPDGDEYRVMVASITKSLNLTSLRYQRLDDCVAAIGLPKSRLCTFCWDGVNGKTCAGCPAAASCSPASSPVGA